jgi:hypothetical protein
MSLRAEARLGADPMRSAQAKLEKRNRRDLFEGSKLIDMQKKQESYEEMFMKVNPLDMGNKNKPKDIHLASIDVTFGSNRILSVKCHTTLATRLHRDADCHLKSLFSS